MVTRALSPFKSEGRFPSESSFPPAAPWGKVAAGMSTRSRAPARRRQASAGDSPPNAFLDLLPAVQRDVDRRLKKFLDVELASARRLGSEVAELASAVAEIGLRGGKRLRPALVVAGFRAVDAESSLGLALDAGTLLELLHTYLLIHDDWMDGDRTRRGGPSAHVSLGRRFRSRQLGDAAAILAGDYAAGLSTLALGRLAVPAERLPALLLCFAEMQLAAVAGQQLDLLGTSSDVEATYALKTGSYTVEGPLRLGALLGGAGRRTLAALSAYARPLGIAFQLRDDLASIFGDPRTTGKPLAGDLRTGKRTALVVHALGRARGADRRALAAVLGNRRASRRALQQALTVIEASGARKLVEARIEELADSAVGALRSFVTAPGRELLEGAARALTTSVG
jgi:geranylgeranyl diphosphate synthase type I